jgi:hypothetical protein
MLRESVETPKRAETPQEVEERIRSLSTLEGQEKFRKARELLARERNMEQPKLPPTPPAPAITCEVKIRGDGRGVEITGGDEGAMDQ